MSFVLEIGLESQRTLQGRGRKEVGRRKEFNAIRDEGYAVKVRV